MEKVIFVVLVLCVLVMGHKSHPKFPPRVPAEIGSNTKKGPVACSKVHDTEFQSELNKSKCGEPKEEFITLEPSVKHETVIPSGAWVKRCHGLCDHYNNEGFSCVPIDVQIRHIPVRVYNLETGKESCRHFPVKEHLSCGCCSPDQDECPENMVFNPRKCTCQCPNMDERRNCLKNKPYMKWNRSTCTCERRKKFASSKRSTFGEFYDSRRGQRTS